MPIQASGPLETGNLFKYVRITPGCWIWEGAKDTRGYGICWVSGIGRSGAKRAHKVSYEYYIGEVPEGLVLRHRCNNTSCVNPYHLIPGTQKENVHDSIAAGTFPKRTSHGMTKLSEQNVIEIKELLQAGMKHREIAEKFGIARTMVTKINNGQRWKD